ncbi:TolC family protein [Rhodobacterales bacterium]|nr:TolC family protein [Rhodobacterales bacterium]
MKAYHLGILCCAALAGCSNSVSKNQEANHLSQLPEQKVAVHMQESMEPRQAVLPPSGDTKRRSTLRSEDRSVGQGRSVPLGELLANALTYNSEIAKAAKSVDRASAQRMNAYLGYLPQVSLSYTADHLNEKILDSDNVVYQLGEAAYPVVTAGVTIEQPLFDLARLYGISSASASRKKAEMDYISALAKVSGNVFETYLSALQSKGRIKALKKRSRLLASQVSGEDTLQRTGLGDVARLAALRSSNSDLAAEEALETASYADALAALSRLTGTLVHDVEPVPVPKRLLGVERTFDVNEAVADSLSRNPELIAAALALTSANARARQAWAQDFVPVIKGYYTYEDEDRSASRFGGGSHTQDSRFGIQLSVPIFNVGGAGYGNMAASIDAQASAIDYDAASRQLEIEIRSTYRRMSDLTAALADLDAAAAQARSAHQAEQAKLRTGETTELAVAAREFDLSKATEKTEFYRAEYLKHWGRLQVLLGRDLFNMAET